MLTRYLVGSTLARLADEGSRVGLVLLAAERTSSVSVGGLLVAALLVPHVAAAPLVGRAVDRARRPAHVIAFAVLLFGVCVGGAAVVLGRLPLWAVVLVLVLGGCAGPAVTGGLTSRLPAVVPAGSLPRVFGVDSLVYNLCGVAGPAVVGVVTARAGAGPAMVALAAAAVVSALPIATLPDGGGAARDDRPRPSQRGGVVRLLVHDRTLLTVTAASSGAQLGLGGLGVVATVVAERHGEIGAAGLLLAVVPAGSLAGSLLWTWRPVPASRAPRAAVWSLVGMGAPLAVAGLVPSLAWAAVLFGVSGLFLGPATSALFTTRQDRAPTDLTAQVFSVGAGLKMSGAAAGAALGGAIAGLDTPWLLAVVAAFPVACGLAGAAVLSRSHPAIGPVPAPVRSGR